MKIHFMLAYARDKGDAPILDGVISNLAADGFDVTAAPAESVTVGLNELTIEADLYVLKSKHPLWLNVAAILDRRGARMLNSYQASVTTLDKITATAALAAAEIPVPRSWATGDITRIWEFTGDIPLVVKPNIGHGSSGIRIVRDKADIPTMSINEAMLVQELITPVEDELKLYVIGERVFGIRKDPVSMTRQTVRVEPILAELALRCGRALGLDIYGADVLLGTNGPVVIDVNYFPSFRGVAGAAGALTDHIVDCVKQ